MNTATAVINIKTEPQLKEKAQKAASEMGLTLTSVINRYLKDFVKTKKITFYEDEEPSPYLISQIKKAEKNLKEGKGSPVFHTGEEAVKWLEEQGI